MPRPRITWTLTASALAATGLLGVLALGTSITPSAATAANPASSATAPAAVSDVAPQPTVAPALDVTPTPTTAPTAAPTQPSAAPAPAPKPPAVIAEGATGVKAREVQLRLRQLGFFKGDTTTTYGPFTASAVAAFQTAKGITPTGELDQASLDLLWSLTRKPTADELNPPPPAPVAVGSLDPRCLTGRVLCASKAARKLYWVIDGQVQLALDARFGTAQFPSDNGQFSVYLKRVMHYSTLYNNAPMPFSMFYNGGEAVHFNATFASSGWGTARNPLGSHGCINTRDYARTQWLFGQVQLGDQVVVY